jgi:3D-(3,5/4)-trihydroxycyclohexane-1,2-dione acylhydrolase (decyclizing)
VTVAPRLTVAQAIVEFLARQHVARDGHEQPFFAGMFGIFGHGNVAGIGQALHQAAGAFRYYQARNEQAMVHTAAAFARMHDRLRTFACTASIGPGATNMITAAAGATINRLPVLLLPGDLFATRGPAPVLQQLEAPGSQELSVNDCFKPVSRYWDRINRPEQILSALPEAMRVLTSPAETGAVTLALPQDVQTEAFSYPEALFEKRVWTIPRPRPDQDLLGRAATLVRSSRTPLIIAGGGVIYSGATGSLRRLADRSGIPVAETQAGKGSLAWDHPQALGAIGVTGSRAANLVAREADVVVVVGSRLTDFTTASKTAFARPDVRVVGINVAEMDAYKLGALPLVGDARVTLDELGERLAGWAVGPEYRQRVVSLRSEWEAEVDRIRHPRAAPVMSQAEVIGVVNEFAGARDVIVGAAGSLPGDLHKLWRTRDPKGYHLEYGYSCMGYEIAGGLGVKLAAPDRDVYVMVGDGSYLMMAQEIATAVQEHVKLTIILLDNDGFASIGGLSRTLGTAGFGTEYRYRNPASGQLDGDFLRVDFAANAASLGAHVWRATDPALLRQALAEARQADGPAVVVVPVDREQRVGSYESWWDVPVAEVATADAVRRARTEYERARQSQRRFL